MQLDGATTAGSFSLFSVKFIIRQINRRVSHEPIYHCDHIGEHHEKQLRMIYDAIETIKWYNTKDTDKCRYNVYVEQISKKNETLINDWDSK